jgi:Gpi18-like mannosyltransferase
MKAALKVLNDYLRKSPITSVPPHLKNATNIVQQEWFKVQTYPKLQWLAISGKSWVQISVWVAGNLTVLRYICGV